MLRQTLITTLHHTLAALPSVHAAWLGGSDATGRTDDLSDIDIQAIADDDAIEPVLAAAESSVAALSPIERRYRVPEPAWHGHSQVFLKPRAAPDHLFIDLCIIKRSAPPGSRFLEPERHGHPQILFDRADLLAPVPLDRAAHAHKVAARLADLRARAPLFRVIAEKCVPRNLPVEAAAAHQAFLVRPLIDLLRIRHCPDRFDYGPRYLDRDLPPDLADTLARLSFAPDLTALADRMREAADLFDRTLRDMDAEAATTKSGRPE